MKKILTLITFCLIFCQLQTKAQLLKKIKDKANEKIENTKNKAIQKTKDRVNNKEAQADAKVDNTMDKGLDKVEDVFKKKEKDAKEDNKEEDKKEIKEVVAEVEKTTVINSKYDFKTGDNIVYFNDFNQTNVGDFPTGLTSMASGELITLGDSEQKWLMLGSTSNAQLTNRLYMATNSTIEFDTYHKNGNSPSYFFGCILFKKSKDNATDLAENEMPGESGVSIKLYPAQSNENTNGGYAVYKNGNISLENYAIAVPNIASVVEDEGVAGKEKYNHISITRTGARLRVYVNTTKIIDLPTAFAATEMFDGIKLVTQNGQDNDPATKDIFAFTNLKVANGLTVPKDIFAKQQKYVSNAIQFEIGKANINTTSHFALKEIADAINATNLKVQIVGHTDANGDAAKNVALSKLRSEAVKGYLIKNFNCKAANLTTDGKGSSQLVDKTTTNEANAINRRVEFIKVK